MSFQRLPAALAAALASRGFDTPTPVQTAATAPEAAGRDLLVTAKTGSGKTVAYGLALGETLLEGAERLPRPGAPGALVVAPTRELALQVREELQWLLGPSGGRVLTCVGGMDPRREQRGLADGASVVVGTPGRLRDHIERGHLDLSALKVLVLDEADEMLDLGFAEELDVIFDSAPPDRRTLLFSATLPSAILSMARERQSNPLRLALGAEAESHSEIDYAAHLIAPADTERAIVNLLRYVDAPAALVFCATREAVTHLKANLLERGFSVVALSGELSQSDRTAALSALRDKRARVCVATDVAARGLDVKDLELVIHADLPRDEQALKHRSGRTGRGGKRGRCAVLVPFNRRRRAETLFRSAGIDIAFEPPPGVADILRRDEAKLIDALVPSPEVEARDLEAARTLLERHDAEALIATIIRERRLLLPPPEDLGAFDPQPSRPAAPARPGFEAAPWFGMNIGRRRNADPKWILPLICNRGGLTKADIGAIRIFDEETRFQVSGAAAEAFFARVNAPSEDKVRIWALDSDVRGAVGGRRPHREDAPKKRDPRPHWADPAGARPDEAPARRPGKGRHVGGASPAYEGQPAAAGAPPAAGEDPGPALARRPQKAADRQRPERSDALTEAGYEAGPRPDRRPEPGARAGEGRPRRPDAPKARGEAGPGFGKRGAAGAPFKRAFGKGAPRPKGPPKGAGGKPRRK